MSKKKVWLFIVLPVFLIIIISFFFLNRDKDNNEYTTVKASLGPLTQTVIESGTIRPVKELNLNFPNPGRITEINVKVGDEILVDETIAKLDSSSLLIRKIEAEAGLQIAQANLSKILAGVNEEAILVSQRSLDQAEALYLSAKNDLEKLEKSLEESIAQAERNLSDLKSTDSANVVPQRQAVISAEINLQSTKNTNLKNINHSRSLALINFKDKVLVSKIAMDNVFTLLEDDDAKNVLSAKDSSWLTKVRNGRLLSIDLLKEADEKIILAEESDDENLAIVAGEASLSALNRSRQVLSDSYFMLEATITSSNFSQAKLDSYKATINSQINQLNMAISSVQTSIQSLQNAILSYENAVLSATESLRQAEANLNNAINSASNHLNSLILSSEQQLSAASSSVNNALQSVFLAEAQLANTKTPVRSQDIELARAQVSQAEANILSIEKQIEDNILVSPIAGVITNLNYSVGELFSPSSIPFVSVLVNNIFEIEVDISESDINKVKIGDEAKITLDAFGSDVVFSGQVYFIEPAQTIIQGVVYYKVKIEFTSLQEWLSYNIERRSEIKSGMTANVEITTAKRDEVIKIPARAIIETDEGRVIRILKDDKLEEVIVRTGLRGDDGLVEISEGLSEGDNVVTFIRSR